MTLNEIAWYLVKKFGLTTTYGRKEGLSKAFRIAAQLIKKGAYRTSKKKVKKEAAQLLDNLIKKESPESPKKKEAGKSVSSDEDDIAIPPVEVDDGVRDDADALAWIEGLIGEIEASYTGDADFYEDAQKLIKQILKEAKKKYDPNYLDLYKKLKDSGIADELDKLMPYPEGNRQEFESEYRLANGKISLTWLTMVKSIMDEIGLTESEVTQYSVMEDHFFI